MKLNDIIKNDLNLDIEITDLTDDSRTKMESGIFFASKGLTVDGHNYISGAVKNGARVVVCERKVDEDVPQIVVPSSNVAFNEALNNFHNRPLDKLKLIGVTGTDGKTTTTEILYQLLNYFDKCGYIGTNGVKCPLFRGENSLTTPLPKELFADFHEFASRDCNYVSMEVSSERLYTERLDGIDFEVSIFTNLTNDHLDTHKTMENYAAAKAKLFNVTKGVSIINADDKYCEYFSKQSAAPVKTFGIDNKADIYADNIKIEETHLEFDIHGYLGDHHIETNISGKFNVYNIMSAIVVLDYYGYEIDKIMEAISELKPIDARQMVVDQGQDFRVWIDYAHTPAAVKILIDFAREFTEERIIVVTGAAGSRDPYRSIQTAIVCVENADYNIFTIEDSRGEDPEVVINRMVEGLTATNFETEINREKAIIKALEMARTSDTILILGKGLESFEKVNGQLVAKKNDFEIADEYLLSLKNKKN